MDDKLIPNSINIAQDCECFYFSYFKIKNLLDNNESIDTLYLGFSFHSLSDYYDDFIFGQNSAHITARYFFVFPNSEKVRFLKYNQENVSLLLKNAIESGWKKEWMGGYENIFKGQSAAQKSMDKRALFQFYENGKPVGFSAINHEYLEKTVQLCREKKVELRFLNTPLHDYYQGKIPAEHVQKYEAAVRVHQLKVVDFAGLVLGDDCFIPDGDHVSEKGAAIASDWFAKNRNN